MSAARDRHPRLVSVGTAKSESLRLVSVGPARSESRMPGDPTPPPDHAEHWVSKRRDWYGNYPRVHFDSSGHDPIYHKNKNTDGSERVGYVMDAQQQQRGRGRDKSKGKGNGKPRGRPPAHVRNQQHRSNSRCQSDAVRFERASEARDGPCAASSKWRKEEQERVEKERVVRQATYKTSDAHRPPTTSPRPSTTPPRDAEAPDTEAAKTSSRQRREREQKAEDDRMIRLAMARPPARARGPSAFVDPRHREQPLRKRSRVE